MLRKFGPEMIELELFKIVPENNQLIIVEF